MPNSRGQLLASCLVGFLCLSDNLLRDRLTGENIRVGLSKVVCPGVGWFSTSSTLPRVRVDDLVGWMVGPLSPSSFVFVLLPDPHYTPQRSGRQSVVA